MDRSIFAGKEWLEALYIRRAIFHDVAFKGEVCPFLETA